MKNFILILIFSINTFASNIFFTSKKINFEFTDASKLSFISAINGPDFKGIINIRDSKYSPKNIDFYNFKSDSDIKVSDEYCQKKLEQLYGPRNDRSIMLDSLKILNSNHGSFCAVIISTDSEIMTIKKRYMMIGFIKAQSVLLEWSYTNAKADIESDKLLEFWNSLK